MLLTKRNHPCPACGAAPGAPCTRGKRKQPITVFCRKRPADVYEVIATGKSAPMALPA